jgi:hypothetical protein
MYFVGYICANHRLKKGGVASMRFVGVILLVFDFSLWKSLAIASKHGMKQK